MNRREFMRQLERLLYDIPDKDREEALDYYEAYFDDAGEEREDEVIWDLGSPGRVAAEIKASLQPDLDAGEYTDAGYQDERFEQGEDAKRRPARYRNGREERGRKILLLVLLGILTLPFWGAALGVLAGVLAGIAGALVGLFAGTLFGGIGLVFGGIVAMIVAGFQMTMTLPLGLVLFGIGMILLAIGVLLLLAFGWLVKKAVPAVIRFVVDVFHRLLHRHRKEEER